MSLPPSACSSVPARRSGRVSTLGKIAIGLLNVSVTAAHRLSKAFWFVSRPKTFGAHAVALTPQGKLILVKLRYADGWRVPGGGRSEQEDPLEAALRELREEIGMISHGEARLVRDFEEAIDFKRGTASLSIVRNVLYRPPSWSWEVERICEADPDSLPDDLAAAAERWIDAVRPLL